MLFESQLTFLYQLTSRWYLQKRKADMRELLSQKRRVQPKEVAARASEAICSRLEALPEFQRAQSVLFYYPIHGEVDVRPLLEKYQSSKVVLLPVAHRYSLELRPYAGRKDLKRGRFGIPEPQTRKYKGHIDLIVVPGVAFDRQLNRLGRGGGYYDRFLKKYQLTTKVAVAYDFQMVDEVPVNKRDHKVNLIITPNEVISCS